MFVRPELAQDPRSVLRFPSLGRNSQRAPRGLGDDLAAACEQLWVPHAGTERSLWMRGISGSQSSAFRILYEHLNWERVIDDVDAVVLVVFLRL